MAMGASASASAGRSATGAVHGPSFAITLHLMSLIRADQERIKCSLSRALRADESEDGGDSDSSEEAPLVQRRRAPPKKPAAAPAAGRPAPKGKKARSCAVCFTPDDPCCCEDRHSTSVALACQL